MAITGQCPYCGAYYEWRTLIEIEWIDEECNYCENSRICKEYDEHMANGGTIEDW